MDKKGTKIAYFVACAVFVVLLVVLGISFKGAPLPEFVIDGETVQAETPFAGTFWSLLPPIVAIVLALISKEVYSSLFLGCLVRWKNCRDGRAFGSSVLHCNPGASGIQIPSEPSASAVPRPDCSSSRVPCSEIMDRKCRKLGKMQQ